MNFQQIGSFLALCETLNYTKTAQLLHLSQSVVSRHIFQMEEELGFRLFRRSNRSVILTESGEAIRAFFFSAREDYLLAVSYASRVAEPSAGSISVRLLDLFDNRIILNAINTFPQTTFHIERYTTPCHPQDFLSGRFDVGVGYAQEMSSVPGTQFRELRNSRDNIICAQSYTAPKHREERSLFMVSDDMKTPANIAGDRAKRLGLENYRIRLVPNIASALTAVESGMGYTLLKDFSLPFVNFPYRKTMLNAWQSIGLAWVDDPKRPHIQRFVEACFNEAAAEFGLVRSEDMKEE